MVSWSGSGYIKPSMSIPEQMKVQIFKQWAILDEPWDIESLMSASARFPDLVARTPQRT